MLKAITYEIGQSAVIVDNMACIKSNTDYDISDIHLPTDISNKIKLLYNGIYDANVIPTEFEDYRCFHSIADEDFDCTSLSYVFNIFCPQDTDIALLEHHSGGLCYVWVNDEYIGRSSVAEVLQMTLKSGDNCICFSFFSPNLKPGIAVRLNLLSNEINQKYMSLARGNYSYNFCKARSLNIEYDINQRGTYKGLLFSFDRINIDISQIVNAKVVDYYTDNIYATYTVKFNEPFEIELPEIEGFKDERVNFFELQFEYYYKDGRKKSFDMFFAYEPPETSKPKLCNEAQKILDDPDLLDTARIYIESRLTPVLETDTDDLTKINTLLYILKLSINNVLRGKYPRHEYIPRGSTVHYYSKLDNQLYRYDIYLPENYDKTKRYPLVIHNSFTEQSFISVMLNHNDYKSEVIIATAASRGVTLGSYVGEASINEVLDDIKQRFSIDETRVSAFGHSNGAASTWLHAELMPHRFAAIAPCAGYFHSDLIKNLRNMTILDVESQLDKRHWDMVQECSEEFSNIKNYSLIEADSYTHLFGQYMYINSAIIEALSKCVINPYPAEVSFRAIHNRHLDAYWISIHSIEDYSEYGEIEAQISGEDTINVECSHITGFTIRIPLQITSQIIHVIVNGQMLKYERNSGTEINIIRIPGTDEYTFGEMDPSRFKIYHGTGLLDVFLTPISIINFNPNSSEMVNSALHFSTPQMNTYNPKLYISYPICTPNDMDLKDFEERSLIVLDNNSPHEVARNMRMQCEIKMDEGGFEYANKRYEGEYCIMQILRHPSDPNCSILYINANNPELYRKNFFTRQIIIPMYGKRRHPFLNNAALVFYENKYYAVFEYGSELCEVKSRE